MKRPLLKPFFTVSVFLVLACSLFAQARYQFLDQKMNAVASKDGALYHREVIARSDGFYDVTLRFLNGDIMMIGTYSDESLETEEKFFRYFFANGQVESEGNYERGIKIGTWKRWDFEGNSKSDREYPEEVPLALLTQMRSAEFPGGDESLTRYLEENLVYPQEAIKTVTQGTVYVAFNISSDGYISQVQVVQNVNFFLDSEARRLVTEMPRWKPARKNDIDIDSKFILPVKFDIGVYTSASEPSGSQ